MTTKKRVLIISTVVVGVVAILLSIILPLILLKKDDNYLYNIFMDSKEAFNRVDNWNNISSNHNSASQISANKLILAAQNNEKNVKLIEDNGYYNYGLVSYYTGDSLHKFLYEENNSISKVIKQGQQEIQDYLDHQNDDPNEYDYPEWMDDVVNIKGIMTLDITMLNGVKERTVIATEFTADPHTGPHNFNEVDPPVILAKISNENLKNYYGIHYVQIEKDSDNGLVYFTNVLPIKMIIDHGLTARDEGYYSEDMKIFYKLNTLDPFVTIANGTETIADFAFYLPTLYSSITINTSLKEVVLPNSVKYIGRGAFGECMALEKVNSPKSLEYLDDSWNVAYMEYTYETVKNYFPDEQIASPENLHLFDFEID